MKKLPALIILSLFCILPAIAKNPAAFQVELHGLTGKALQNAYQRINTKKQLLTNDTDLQTIVHFYEDLPNDIKAAIEPYGYFKPKIIVHYKNTPKGWQGNYTIIPGPRMKIRLIDIKLIGPGAHALFFEKYLQKHQIHEGDFLESDQYEKIKNHLQIIAARYGYFKSKIIKSALRVNLNNYTADLILHFNTGPRYFFGNTYFSASPFSEKFLRKFLYYKEGDEYLSQSLQDTREAFANSNYFKDVVVTTDIKNAKQLKTPIQVDLSMQDRKQYLMGAGFGTDTGPRGLLGVDYRWLNSEGHRFNTMLRGSQINSAFSFNYIIPGRHPAYQQYIFNTTASYQNQNTGNGKSINFTGSYQSHFNQWQLNTGLTYLVEHYTLTDIPSTSNANLLYPYLIIQKRKTDKPLDPNYGFMLSFKTSGTSKVLLSKTSFFQTRIDTKFLFSLWEKRMRFIAKLSLGATSIDNITHLPLSMQFFVGGAESIRGYSYNSIGPGRYLFASSFEIQQKIRGHWYLIGFVEAGNVSDHITQEPLFVGTGPGIGWSSPIGVLELTVGEAITLPHHLWRVQFSMGQII